MRAMTPEEEADCLDRDVYPGGAWAWPDGLERRALLGHQPEWDVPGYCTCGELRQRCPGRPTA